MRKPISTEKRLSTARNADNAIRMISYAEYENDLLTFLESNFSGIYLETRRDGGEGFVAVAPEAAAQVILDLFSELLGRCAVKLENTVSASEAVTVFSFPSAMLPDSAVRKRIAFYAGTAGYSCGFCEEGETLFVKLRLPLYPKRTFTLYAPRQGEFLAALKKVFFEE